jgi:cytochrome P450
MATLVIELAADAAVRGKLAAEIARDAPSGPLALEQLLGMTYLGAVVREVKRVSPVVPGVFGLARTDIEFEGYTIPKGWMLLLGLRTSHQMPEVYASPERFDPDRFGADRAEHDRTPNAFFPHGPGLPATSHHCVGTDYATLLTCVFATVLARRYEYVLPSQDLSYRRNRLTPVPVDGLRATITKRA